jgi:large repetitive protein
MSHYSAVALADAPLRYYRLGESSGTTAIDLGSQTLNGTYTGGFTLGQTGLIVNEPSAKSVTLNGSTGYVSMPTTGLPTGAQSWSIEAWINMASVPGTGLHSIVEFGTNATNNAAVLYLGSGKISANTYAGNTIAGLTPVAGTTYHCVACYDGTNLRLYVNGLLQGAVACTPAITLTYCYIGTEDSPRDDFWAGSIQEAAIYNTALSALQVRTHFQAGLFVAPSTYYSSVVLADAPLRYHRLGETSGIYAVDLGSQQQVASINGGITLGHVGLVGDSDLAMVFDGSTGYVSLPLASLPSGNAAWSLEAWISVTSIPVDSIFHAFLAFGDQSADTGGSIWLKSGALGANTYTPGHTVTGLSPVANKAYHCVATYSGSGTLTFYINGVSQGTVTGLTLNIGAIFAYIGCEENPRDDFFSGIIDEVAIYGAALSAARVLAHYQAARGLTLQRAMHKAFGQIR